MQSIITSLKLYVLYAFFFIISVPGSASVLSNNTSCQLIGYEDSVFINLSHTNNWPVPYHDHQHHMSDVESVDEEPTQQHQHKIDLPNYVCIACLISSGNFRSEFYPSPFFDIMVPPPEC